VSNSGEDLAFLNGGVEVPANDDGNRPEASSNIKKVLEERLIGLSDDKMRTGSGIPVDGKCQNSTVTSPGGKGTADDPPRGENPGPGLTQGGVEMEHGGELARHGVPSEDENPPLLAMELRLLALSTGGLRRAPDRVEGPPKLAPDDVLSIDGGSSFRDKNDVRM